jgi:broad specificity phosphatase PhoE
VIHVVRHGRTRSNRVGLVMGWVDESIEPDQHDARRRSSSAAGGRSRTGAGRVEPTRPGP